jgi:ABC-2 type transport system permease protein
MERLRIAFQFFRRDLYIYGRRMPRYIFQYAFMYPLFFGICWAYLVPHAGASGAIQAKTSSVIFVGVLLFSLIPFTFAITSDFLFDLEEDRFIDYQLILIPAWMILVQRIVFSTFFIFFGLLPFFPFSKIIFNRLVELPYVSWLGTLTMMLAAAFFLASFQIAFLSYAKGTQQIRHFWRRVSYPMSMLGGFLVPWKVLVAFSPAIGYAVLINPYLYITEGLRSAILGGDQFFHWSLCIVSLIVFAFLCMLIAFYLFRKKVDPV